MVEGKRGGMGECFHITRAETCDAFTHTKKEHMHTAPNIKIKQRRVI